MRGRAVRTGLAAAGIVLSVYAAALALLSHPAVESRLREQVVEKLGAHLGEISLEGDVRVDPLLRVSFGPLAVPGRTSARAVARPEARAAQPAPGGVPDGDPDAARAAIPFLCVERVTVRPRLSALLAGRVEPASVELSGVRLALDLAAKGARALPGEAGGALPPGGERPRVAPPGEGAGGGDRVAVRFRQLVAVLPGREGNQVELGPLDGEISRERDGAGERLALHLRLPGGARALLEAKRAPGGAWRGSASASGLGPSVLPGSFRGGAARLEAGAVSLRAEGSAAPDLRSLEARVRLEAHGIVLAGERIGPAPVGPLQAGADGTLAWNGRERRLSLVAGRVSLLGAIEAEVEGEVRLVPGSPFVLSLRAGGLDFASAVAALPEPLAPPPAAPRAAGDLDARARVSGPLLAPSDWSLSASLDLSRMRAAARGAPPVALRSPFVHRPAGAGPSIVVGPANPDFVPVADLPVHVVRAVTTSEDGGFFGHEGFDFEELRNAVAEGAQAGRLVRGGSTITQQLAKNLYLTRERTLTRKVREAVITIALEATVPKQRLLEIYLNVIEWAPGVHGIGPAARHWFGKDARELTPAEAAFLASIIPNPSRYHFMYDRGAITEAWRRRVDDVLFKMTRQGVLGGEDLLRALEEPIVFRSG